jgi:hypothetical protein
MTPFSEDRLWCNTGEEGRYSGVSDSAPSCLGMWKEPIILTDWGKSKSVPNWASLMLGEGSDTKLLYNLLGSKLWAISWTQPAAIRENPPKQQ